MEELLQGKNIKKDEDLSMNNKCKILLVTHKPCKIPESEYIVPIHAGRAVALEKSKDGSINQEDLDWLIKNTIGDNTGDNISAKNRYYSECSALYWAWKNYDELGNPDYIGLMHYRRHFIFDENYYAKKNKNLIESVYQVSFEKYINKKYFERIGLNDQNIKNACNNSDIIVSKDTHFELFGDINLRTDYENNIEGTKVKDFDLMIETVLKFYPEYKPVIDKYIYGYSKLSFSMFIMKKELFFKYCDFLFKILFEMEKYQNFDEYSLNGKRTPGYVAEILLTIFVWKLKEQKDLRISQLGITKVEYTYSDFEIQKILQNRCPSYLSYLLNKIKYILTFNTAKKQKRKTKYKKIRDEIRRYKNIKNIGE